MRLASTAAAAVALLAGLPSVAAPSATPCAMDAKDEAWLHDAIDAWRRTASAHLHLASNAMPPTVVFDKACAYSLKRDADARQWTATPHEGHVRLPDGSEIPVGVVSFARPSPQGTYFVMSLPSIWREKVKSNLGIERLMTAVLLHETSHTAQAKVLAPRLDALPDDMSDDALQEKFSKDPAYVADFTRERDLFVAAATAATNDEAKRIGREALAAYRARRAKWFKGDDAKWADIDDLFLSMEGLGQWTAYAWLVDPNGAGIAPDVALKEMRRGGKWWTQDEGIAVFLLIDRMVPGWQGRFFGPNPPSLDAVLAQATR